MTTGREIRAPGQGGFTLIELLVVILIVGILAAIGLPVFLGQQKKGQDGEAKALARNLFTHVEACFAETQDYTLCRTPAQLGTTGLPFLGIPTDPIPQTPGKIYMYTNDGAPRIIAISRAQTDGIYHQFWIVRLAAGAPPGRACYTDTVGNGSFVNRSGGGCQNGVW